MDCLARARARDLAWIDVRPEVHARLQRRAAGACSTRSVWARTDKSWYKRADGRITNNWSGTTAEYWWRTRRADLTAYRQQPRAKAGEASSREGRVVRLQLDPSNAACNN